MKSNSFQRSNNQMSNPVIQTYVKKILQSRVYDVAEKTPLAHLPNISKRINNHVLLKREDMQPVFSFKLRGAYNKISSLPKDVLQKGIIAASAGNHAQGVALSANRLGIRAVIVMPKTTPDIKVRAVRRWGAEVVLHGNNYDEASQHAANLIKEEGLAYVAPYDDPEVIAGQGTIAMEILHQHSDDLEAIFVPVGGGGLIAGIAAYIKYVRPEIKVIGVEADDSACLYAALKANERVVLDQVGIFADGVAVKQIGKHPFEVARECVDDVIRISPDEMCAAVKDIFEDTRVITEPSGALGLAGLKRYVESTGIENRYLATIASGANTNFDRLQFIAERTEIGEKREALLAVTIPERPGSFKAFAHVMGPRHVTEFNYRYADKDSAQVFVGVRLSDGESEKERLIEKLRSREFPVVDLSDNEMAKLHVRHMVGGHSNNVGDECLYRVIFPERPGALFHFLNAMGERWNISLFHYRNHGDAYGRVLMAAQVPSAQVEDFQTFLANQGYPYWSENDNPAYQLFLN
ncbi:MAG: threonine ammonia-lyase, biosynthetic [Pseudomonadota bacterium]